MYRILGNSWTPRSAYFLLRGGGDGRDHLYHRVIFPSNQSSQFIVDTGSPVTFMPLTELWRLGISHKLQHTSATIKGVSGHKHVVLGALPVDLKDSRNTKAVRINMVVTEQGSKVLGLDGLRP